MFGWEVHKSSTFGDMAVSVSLSTSRQKNVALTPPNSGRRRPPDGLRSLWAAFGMTTTRRWVGDRMAGTLKSGRFSGPRPGSIASIRHMLPGRQEGKQRRLKSEHTCLHEVYTRFSLPAKLPCRIDSLPNPEELVSPLLSHVKPCTSKSPTKSVQPFWAQKRLALAGPAGTKRGPGRAVQEQRGGAGRGRGMTHFGIKGQMSHVLKPGGNWRVVRTTPTTPICGRLPNSLPGSGITTILSPGLDCDSDFFRVVPRHPPQMFCSIFEGCFPHPWLAVQFMGVVSKMGCKFP